jgi:hypothetical protein
MTTIKITKLNVAINQLQMAIDMFLENKDLFCIITLAGAAEEILGHYATRANKKTMMDLLCTSLNNSQWKNVSGRAEILKLLNKPKNSLKHFCSSKTETIEINPEEAALAMLIRAIGNLHSHDKTVTHNTPEFMDWIYENRRDLLQ